MSRRSLGDHVHIHGHFFACLDAHVLNLAVFLNNPASFVDRIASSDFVPVLLDGEFHARFAAGLFVSFGKKDDIAVQPRARALQGQEDREVCDRHSLVVN